MSERISARKEAYLIVHKCRYGAKVLNELLSEGDEPKYNRRCDNPQCLALFGFTRKTGDPYSKKPHMVGGLSPRCVEVKQRRDRIKEMITRIRTLEITKRKLKRELSYLDEEAEDLGVL